MIRREGNDPGRYTISRRGKKVPSNSGSLPAGLPSLPSSAANISLDARNNHWASSINGASGSANGGGSKASSDEYGESITMYRGTDDTDDNREDDTDSEMSCNDDASSGGGFGGPDVRPPPVMATPTNPTAAPAIPGGANNPICVRNIVRNIMKRCPCGCADNSCSFANKENAPRLPDSPLASPIKREHCSAPSGLSITPSLTPAAAVAAALANSLASPNALSNFASPSLTLTTSNPVVPAPATPSPDVPLDMSKTSPTYKPSFGGHTPPPTPPEAEREKFTMLHMLCEVAIRREELTAGAGPASSAMQVCALKRESKKSSQDTPQCPYIPPTHTHTYQQRLQAAAAKATPTPLGRLAWNHSFPHLTV